MDFLGIGPLELIVVLIIALIVVGPERLPQLAQSVGKTLRDLRAMSQGLTNEWQREISSISQLEAGEDLKQVLSQPFKETQAELQKALNVPLAPTSSEPVAKPAPPQDTSSPASPNTQDDTVDDDDT